jgi:hypothetical protein
MGIISNGNTVIDNGAIDANEVDTTQINNDAVTADKLADTAVSAGTYTSATITVDAQGRITGASSGSAGGNGFVPVGGGQSPGNYGSSSGASVVAAVLVGGGGGGGGGTQQRTGASGGNGGVGFFSKDITHPVSYPWSVGGGGTGGTTSGNPGGGNSGNAGGSTNLSNVGTANGGPAGQGGGYYATPSPASPGSAPGANFATQSLRGMYLGTDTFGAGGNAGPSWNSSPNGRGGTGSTGAIIVMENTG